MKVYELIPVKGQKSFYGKAIVIDYENGFKTLISYNTIVLVERPDGSYIRTWNDYTKTTGKHIDNFSGLSKKQYLALEYMPVEKALNMP